MLYENNELGVITPSKSTPMGNEAIFHFFLLKFYIYELFFPQHRFLSKMLP